MNDYHDRMTDHLFDPSTALPLRDVYTVSRLVREAKAVLEGSFPLLWVEGELSNLSRPASGHLYFTLKDPAAQVRCAMFRMRNVHLNFTPANGLHVTARARLSLYEARGDFQLIVEHLEEAGSGALQRAFEALKKRLADEGLFDTRRKKPLPVLPRRIGVITSPSGAAIRDILSVLRRRFPAIPVLIYPVTVQGESAARDIAETLALAARRQDCDILLLARGGGSLEDLWAFNEEVVARAIAACAIPVVTGIGHEIDFTIADFVADQRAPTPSAAAELITPDRYDWLQLLDRSESRLINQWRRHLGQQRQRLDWLVKRLHQQHPGRQLQLRNARINDLSQRLGNAIRTKIHHNMNQLGALSTQLHQNSPVLRLQNLTARHDRLELRLNHAIAKTLDAKRHRLAGAGRALDSVSPLATLQRGYAIVQNLSTQAVVRSVSETQPGEAISARLSDGHILCTVDEVKKS